MMRYLVVDYGPEWPPFKETGDSREISGAGQFPLRGFVGKEYKKERYLKLFGYVYYSYTAIFLWISGLSPLGMVFSATVKVVGKRCLGCGYVMHKLGIEGIFIHRQVLRRVIPGVFPKG